MAERLRYDVAVWVWWPALFPDVVAFVEADTPARAVMVVMQARGLERAARAAVGAPDGVISRWRRVQVPAAHEESEVSA